MSLLLTLSIDVMFQIQEPYSPLPSMSDDEVRVENRQDWIGKLLNNFHGGGHGSGVSTTYERRVPGCNAFSKLLMGVMGGVNFLSFFLRGFRVWRASVLASLMIVVLLAGGCATGGGGGGEQSPSPTSQPAGAEPEVTSEPEGLPTVVEVDPPVKPEAMSSDGEGGAVAALEYFFDVFGYSYVTREVRYLDKISIDGCQFCKKTIKEIDAGEIKEYIVMDWEIERVDSVENLGDKLWLISTENSYTSRVHGEEEAITKSNLDFFVGNNRGEWYLVEVSTP